LIREAKGRHVRDSLGDPFRGWGKPAFILTDCFPLSRVEKKEPPGAAFSVLKEGKASLLSAPNIPPDLKG
jgi:hypothetical protein